MKRRLPRVFLILPVAAVLALLTVLFISTWLPIPELQTLSRNSSRAIRNSYYLGFDLSTQSLKCTVIDASLMVVHTASLNFDQLLPKYSTQHGVHHRARSVVTSPVLMWVEAFDVLLSQLSRDGFAFSRLAAISASGQQHGSVYWGLGASETLATLDPEQNLHTQLLQSFSVADSPVWMDSSTQVQCKQRETAAGGASALAKLTGSKAYTRFTGNQIAKLALESRERIKHTERISLVSSFIASLMTGKYAGIDTSDAGGMNLMNLMTKSWDNTMLNVTTDEDLARMLGPLIDPHQVVGAVSPYLQQRYGFSSSCKVIASSGDNPCSVAGLGLSEAGDVGISLGTSDTLFALTTNPQPGEEGHVFVNPVDPQGSYMAMLVFENGGGARDQVRRDHTSSGTWGEFEAALARTSPGNNGRMGMYLYDPEITPVITQTGNHRYQIGVSGDIRPVESFKKKGCEASFNQIGCSDDDADVRAVVEGRCLSMRLHAMRIGITMPTHLVVTGGGSQSTGMLQIISNVWGLPVYVQQQSDAASFGAALRALHGAKCHEKKQFINFKEVCDAAFHRQAKAYPNLAAHATYERMIVSYQKMERQVRAM